MQLDLPPQQSIFLWGARGTGKSTFLRQSCKDSIYIDLLKADEYGKLFTKPWLMREELAAENPSKLQKPIIIDEIQKIPQLLDEVHWLIENKHLGFILSGSSARKLKHGKANLLGGRAWVYLFFPLVYKEIPNFDLLRALNHGLLPKHYLTENPRKFLQAYVRVYLKEEIQAEGLVRNLPAFARFLEVASLCNTEMVDYTNIARDCGIDAKTVKAYFQILVDTFVGYSIEPFILKHKRDIITATPKFYFFDVGIANHLSKIKLSALSGFDVGKSFEHFILMELQAYIGINDLDQTINYWRSKTGLEVDFVLDRGNVAIEVKLTEDPKPKDLKGLFAFYDDYKPKFSIVVCLAKQPRLIQRPNGMEYYVLPWEHFLNELWGGKYFT
ncbi:MAG TPA: AAA family ATPase [Gammaproteobacteria bacterium]|nr:AAA family ATPase [Gammaproteobacteria bacterium]